MVWSLTIILLVALLGADATKSYRYCKDSQQLCIDSNEICVPSLDRNKTFTFSTTDYRRDNYDYNNYNRSSYEYKCKKCDAQGPVLECLQLDATKQAGYECCADRFCSLKRERNLVVLGEENSWYDYWYYACRKCPAGEGIHECQDKRVKCCASEICSSDYTNQINICIPKCKEEDHHLCPDKKLSCCNSDRCVFDYALNHYVCKPKCKEEDHHQCPDKKLSCCDSDRCVFDYALKHYICKKDDKK